MKRCEICDSSEEIDTSYELGIYSTKIQYWIKSDVENSPHYICSRCWEDINNTIEDKKNQNKGNTLDKHVVIDNMVIEDSIELDDFLEYTEAPKMYELNDLFGDNDDYDAD